MYNDILPNYINNFYRYIEVDNFKIASFVIIEYPKNIEFMQFIDSIPKNILYDFCLYIKKQDPKKVLKDITSNLAITKSEIDTINKNQVDIDILNKTQNDAKMIRHEIQINNEEIYYVYSYFTVYIKDISSKDIFYSILKEFESRLYSKQIITHLSNFRQLDTYIATLPISNISQSLLKEKYNTLTTSNLAYIFPFFTKNILDKNGIIFGNNIEGKSVNIIDIFNEKYLNANMCVFGSSGSGKSFFIKLNIIRQYFLGIRQYVFDPEAEYIEIVKRFNQPYVNFDDNIANSFNLLEFLEYEIDIKLNTNYLDDKIKSVINFIIKFIDLNDLQINILYECIKNAYNQKGINQDIDSIYLECYNGKSINLNKQKKTGENIPNLNYVFLEIEAYIKQNNKKNKLLILKDLKEKFKENILQKLKFLCNYQDVDLAQKLIIYDISKLNNKEGSIILEYILENIEKNIKYLNSEKFNKSKSIIYIDEVWKYIGSYGNHELAKSIFRLYKTIRKLNSSIITITQDILDFFEYENGNYGKSIINNSAFRMFFKLNYSDVNILKKIGVLDESLNEEIYSLNKGQASLFLNNCNIVLDIKANKFEENIIKGDEKIEDYNGY